MARVDGDEVSVPGALPGEVVELHEGVDARGRARVARVVSPSPNRAEPRCRHTDECGGCAWQHVAYGEQLRLKQARVQFLLDDALGRGRVRVRPTVPTPAELGSDAPWHFRNKVSFAFDHEVNGDVVMGHLRRGSRQVLDVSECPVHAEQGNTLAAVVKEAVLRAGVECGPPPRGVVRHVVVRVGQATSEVLGTLVASRPDDALAQVTRDVMSSLHPPDGWHLNLHPLEGSQLFGRETRLLAGRERLKEVVQGVTFLVSATAFFQTNVPAAGLLLDRVLDAAGPAEGRTLDLYAGLGFFSIPLAMRGHDVVAVEENPLAVEDGVLSARANGVDATRCRFVRGKTGTRCGA